MVNYTDALFLLGLEGNHLNLVSSRYPFRIFVEFLTNLLFGYYGKSKAVHK